MLNVAIAGSGITGLAAAISLRRNGHKVTIYERSALKNEVGAAIHVPPNVGRFLAAWGVDPVQARFVSARNMYFISPFSMEEMMKHDHSRDKEMYGASVDLAHRVDLHESLKSLATNADGPGVPAKIETGAQVVAYDPERPSMTLADGTVVTADLIIAADGVNSIAPEAITGQANPAQPAGQSNCCYRFLIPTAVLEANPATESFIKDHPNDGTRLFPDIQGRRRLIAYPCRNAEFMNFVAICYNADMTSRREDWNASVDKAEVLEKFAGFHPGLLSVIDQATEVKRWPLLCRPALSTWHKGKLVLAGDAAHPMLPFRAQGSAMGIEDGCAIGLVMQGVTDNTQIEDRLGMYEKVRYNRASFIQAVSNSSFDEKLPEETVKYLEGRPAPVSPKDMLDILYCPDVVEDAVKAMQQIIPGFKVPADFFPGSTK